MSYWTGRKHSKESIAKMSAAKMGHKVSLEARSKMSEHHKGISPSLSIREKIRESNKGKLRSLETRTRISNARKGLILSPETRAKISAAKMGQKNSLEVRAKISAALKGTRKGDKNPHWLGGISREPYGWEWDNKLRKRVRQRDGYSCQLCGGQQLKHANSLSVHHIDYDKRNNDPVNLIALCNPCHMRTGGNRYYWTALFQELMIQRGIIELDLLRKASGR